MSPAAAAPDTGGHRGPYVDPVLYDIVYSWYDADLAFYVELAKRSAGPVLEVACGTGRILLPTRAAGVDIDGIDLEPAMIERLRAKAAAANLSVDVAVADMRDFTRPRRYALITIPFRAFMHLKTTEDQLRALRCIRDHLEPGGALVMNQFYPSPRFMAEHDGKRTCDREFQHPDDGTRVELWDLSRYDRVNQVTTVEREVVRTDAAGARHTLHRYTFTLRWSYRFELELLLEAAGYRHWEVRGGFDGRPLERETDEMIWTASPD